MRHGHSGRSQRRLLSKRAPLGRRRRPARGRAGKSGIAGDYRGRPAFAAAAVPRVAAGLQARRPAAAAPGPYSAFR
ncbi:MAG: hypothetical protein AVDCRST_MAG71-1339 [uncultured Lysobacter sp.]|uniref:Uncharacterized protein n=1 Tax=uncultured Lysobacter sp. TaxID=271060 RepID=A0A6J4L4C2_9GAMM|nr:MAG: hypothetical protein AVDCRST_MAG71-1339 [uncultured Lysobacter sp.]